MKHANDSWQSLIIIYHLHVLNPINLQVWLECLYKKHPSVIMCRVIWFTLLPDKNECYSNNGGCKHRCHNSHGSFSCSCYSGYTLGYDRRSCYGKKQPLTVS